MTTNESFDERLSSWLRDTSDRRVPDHLDEVMIVTAATRQRPWWSSPERWLPMDLTSRASTLAFPRMGRLLLVGLLILVLVALAIVAVGSRQQRIPPPFGPAANGSILSWDVAGDILASEPDGSNRRPILSDPAFDFAPWYSHDGTRFVFWRRVSEHESEVMVANADGSGVRSLSRGPLTDADWYEWSPGDDLVAVVHSHEGQRIVTIIDAKGSAQSRDLDLGELDVDNNVYWLPPTGDELVFTARETPDSKDSGLYAVKRDGMGLRLLGPVATEQYFDLAVASDGKRIAYSNIEADQSGNGIGWHIHLRDIQTGADRQVTFDPRASGEVDEHGPMFSPDGTQILLWTQDGDTGRLAIAPSDGRGLTRPLGPPFLWSGDYGYGFAPDGRTANLNIGAGTTWLIDLPSGKGTRLDESIPNFSTWQRLAQPLP